MKYLRVFIAMLVVGGAANSAETVPSFSLVADGEMSVATVPEGTVFLGSRIAARIDNFGPNATLQLEADEYSALNSYGEKGGPAAFLNGNVVVSDGELVLSGDSVVFDLTSHEVTISNVRGSTTIKSGGIAAYSCRSTRLYRNGERVLGDQDLVCNGNYCVIYYCKDGKVMGRMVVQTP